MSNQAAVQSGRLGGNVTSEAKSVVLIEAGQTIKWKGVDYYIKEVCRSRSGGREVRMAALHGRDHCIVDLDYLEDTL